MKKSIVIEINEKNQILYENIKGKVEFYIVSLWLLFLMLIILTIDIPIYFGVDSNFIGFTALIERNIVTLISIIFLIIGVNLYLNYRYKFKGTMQLPVRVTNIENIDYEHLTFLTTYIIPLVFIEVSNPRHLIVLILLLVIIGYIYIKTDLFFANPTLALLGYHIYKVETNSDKIPLAIFISMEKLSVGDKVQYLPLDNKTYFVGGIKK